MTTTTTIASVTWTHADTLVLTERDGKAWCACSECNRAFWAHRFGPRDHNGWCDSKATPTVGASTVTTPAPETRAFDPGDLNRRATEAARTGLVSKYLTSDEAVAAVNLGYLSVSDAMNRDD